MKPLAFLLTATLLSAQHPHATPAEKPVILFPGLGTYQFPIATTSTEAQQFFNQGLTMLYGFNRYEALRSFWRASELDPSALMPRVAAAFAQGPHINMDGDMDSNLSHTAQLLRKLVPFARKPPAASRPGLTRPHRVARRTMTLPTHERSRNWWTNIPTTSTR